MTSFIGATARWSNQHPWIVLALTALTTAGLLSAVPGAEFADPQESMSAEGLPAKDTLERIREIWGDGDPAFLYFEDPDPTDPTHLRALDYAATAARDLDVVHSATSITDPLRRALGPLDQASDDEIRQAFSRLPPDAVDRFIAEDAAIVRLQVDPDADPRTVLDALHAFAADTARSPQPAGPLFNSLGLEESARGELGFIMPASILILLALLAFMFRRLRDVTVPLVVVGVALAMAVGALAWSGLTFGMQTMLVLPLLLGLGVDYMFHIVYPYRDLRAEPDPAARFERVGTHDGKPIMYTAITTFIGFATFLFSPIPQIQAWGLLVAIGVLGAFVLGFTLLPALFRFSGQPKKERRLPLGDVMDRVANLAVRRRRLVLATGALLTVGLAAAIPTLDYEGTLDFPVPASPEKAALDNIEDRFGGQTLGHYLMEDPTRERIERLETALHDVPGIGFVDGPMRRLAAAGNPEGPLEGPATATVMADGYARITFGYDEAEGDAVVAILQSDAFDNEGAELTGEDILRQQAQSAMLDGVIQSIAVSLGLVAIILLFIFRNVAAATLTFVPLTLAIVWQLGLQALIGIPFNPITGVMTAMIMGVGVDYSLHVVSHFREHVREGYTRADAAAKAIRGVGRPVVAATITTAGAFGSLSASDFTPLSQFGSVALISILSAVVISMLLLPAAASIGSAPAVQAAAPPRTPYDAAAKAPPTPAQPKRDP